MVGYALFIILAKYGIYLCTYYNMDEYVIGNWVMYLPLSSLESQ